MSGKRCSLELLEQIRGLVAASLTARQVAEKTGMKRKAVLDIVKRHQLGPWIGDPRQTAGSTIAIPVDFAERWRVMTYPELAAHYQRSSTTISGWVKRLGLKRGAEWASARRRSDLLPADFAETQRGRTLQQLMQRYGRGRTIIRRWIAESGIKRDEISAAPLRFTKPNAFATAPVDRPHRDVSRAGLAADFLRRFGPVARCNADGRYNPNGTHWRRNSSVLTAAEVIERAERLGWQPDSWKEVRAA